MSYAPIIIGSIILTKGGLLVQRCVRPYILDFRILYMFQSYILYSLNSLDTPIIYDSVKRFYSCHNMVNLRIPTRKCPIGCHKGEQDMYRYQG